ncbi:MAG: sulfatase [Opitutaceae bacterium]|nr:sulfatase [Opitutaceae bacterium]
MRKLLPLLAWATAAFAADSASRPNVVVIVADDLGWRDLRCYGSAWHDTPHLDRLAREGMRFTHGYAAAPICSASRVALLTGRSPARLGFEFVTKEPTAKPPAGHPLRVPPYPLNLALEETTLGELLGGAGYATGYFGKWHVSQHHNGYLNWSPTHSPLQQGYAEGEQEFGSHAYGDATRPASEKGPLPRGDYGPDALTDKAIAFLRAHRADTRPFYLHLSHYYVHTPIRTRAAWLVEKYAARLPAGADPRRAVYGAMVEILDHLVGRVLTTLDELGLARNTLAVFTSDNGGHPEFAANGPLRGSKWNVYEGGVRVPWVVRWPGRVRAGATSDVPFIGTDLLPTLAAATGAALPRDVTLDGRNVLPLWLGQRLDKADTERALVWHFPYYHPETGFAKARAAIGVDDFAVSQTRPQSALRVGDWKLVHFYEGNRDELYRLSTDPSEQTDLAAQEPAKARELRARLERELRAAGARLPQRHTE